MSLKFANITVITINNIFLMNDWIDKYSTVILLPTINAEKVRNKQSGHTQLFIFTVP